MFGQGISRTGELIDLGAEHGIIAKSGAWYSYGDQRIGQGRENAKSFLDENRDIADEVEMKVRQALGIGKSAPDLEVETEGEPEAS